MASPETAVRRAPRCPALGACAGRHEDALPYGSAGTRLPAGFGPSGQRRSAAGDWLSGRAPRSHRGGHWFDPSIAHPAQRPVPILELAGFITRTTPKYSNALAAQPLPELLERIAGGRRGDLGVDHHRDGDLAMPQDLHRYARMYVESSQQGSACLAGAVD